MLKTLKFFIEIKNNIYFLKMVPIFKLRQRHFIIFSQNILLLNSDYFINFSSNPFNSKKQTPIDTYTQAQIFWSNISSLKLYVSFFKKYKSWLKILNSLTNLFFLQFFFFFILFLLFLLTPLFILKINITKLHLIFTPHLYRLLSYALT